MSFEKPLESEKDPLTELYQKAKVLLSAETGNFVREETMEALTAWQEAKEKEADKKNTSLANTELIVARAELFRDSGRYEFALEDIEDALLAAENDTSFPEQRLQELKVLEQEIKESLGK